MTTRFRIIALAVIAVTAPWWVATLQHGEQVVTAPRPVVAHWNVKVTGYHEYVRTDGLTPRPTPTNDRYLVVEVEVANTDVEDHALLDRNATIEMDDGQVYPFGYPLSMATQIIGVGQVHPGERVTGVLSFDVPVGSAPRQLRWVGVSAPFPEL